MPRRTKVRPHSEDRWTSMLPNGRKAEYRSKRLPSGRYKISARVVGTNLSQSKIVDFAVSQADVETVFLSDMMDLAA